MHMKQNQITENWMPARYIRKNGAILDFTGLYEVSDLGRVRSLNYHRTGKAKELNTATYKDIDLSIYYMVMLCKDNKRYLLPVHRLILSSFRPEGHPEGYSLGAVCNHKKERTSTSCINELWNLEWTTQKANVNTEHRRGLQSKAHTNHPSKSKRVRVTDLATGETTVYPSAMEAGRSLGINPKLPAACISNSKGFYKKMNLQFSYID